MKKEDLKIVQGRVEISQDMYNYMKKPNINNIDWEEFHKRKVGESILIELLKNDLIEFEENTLLNGNVQIRGKLTVYKKSED